MPWPPDATEFIVTVIPNKRLHTEYVNVPRPIRNKLGNPKYVKFIIDGDKIILEKSDRKHSSKTSFD